jgi:ATP-binding cassette subfamily C (CFTR/MRP) protein 1
MKTNLSFIILLISVVFSIVEPGVGHVGKLPRILQPTDQSNTGNNTVKRDSTTNLLTPLALASFVQASPHGAMDEFESPSPCNDNASDIETVQSERREPFCDLPPSRSFSSRSSWLIESHNTTLPVGLARSSSSPGMEDKQQGQLKINSSNIDSSSSFARGALLPLSESSNSARPGVAADRDPPQPEPLAPQNGSAEGVQVGAVAWEVYQAYFRSCGWGYVAVALLAMLSSQVVNVLSSGWLSYWSDAARDVSGRTGVEVYAMLGAAVALLTYGANVALVVASLSGSRQLHTDVIKALMLAPMSFFDVTPLGRLTNRYSKDIYTIDEKLMEAIGSYVSCLLSTIAALTVISYVTPMFLVAFLPPAFIYYYTQAYYVPTSRQVQRLDSASRSPIFSHFGEMLEGTTTIRAFRRENRFLLGLERRLDYNTRAYYLYVASNRWLAMRLELVGAFTVFLAMLFAVCARSIASGLGGLSITYALNITSTLNWMVRMTADRESAVVSVERVREYALLTSEAPSRVASYRPLSGWPAVGAIEIKGLSLKYRSDRPLVLSSIFLSVRGGEKVGIVGRTGAGKSSLFRALLRLVEPCEGAVLVDGMDILRMGVHDLRRGFSIIPQEPVLFSGTVRFNLDPFVEYSDDQVWLALRRAHMEAYVASLEKKLNFEVTDHGGNFSLGQKQLLCLARSLLRNSRILLLDEATSAVDHTTDKLVQETIRREFQKATVLTVAHRIDTILNYDRVLVLDNGRIAEQGSPVKLLQNPESRFAVLWEAHRRNKQQFSENEHI